jgi:hypothetical protein
VLRDVALRHLPAAVADRPKDGFPTIGHEQLQLAPAFFTDGWLAEALGWSPAGVEELCRGGNRVVAGRLASVEVFGRLYGHDDDPDDLTDHLRRHVRIVE